MESFIFMCLCAVRGEALRRAILSVEASKTAARQSGLSVETTENGVRAVRARGRFGCRFWARASSGCRGDPYARRGRRGARRPGSLGAEMRRCSDRVCSERRRFRSQPFSEWSTLSIRQRHRESFAAPRRAAGEIRSDKDLSQLQGWLGSRPIRLATSRRTLEQSAGTA